MGVTRPQPPQIGQETPLATRDEGERLCLTLPSLPESRSPEGV